MLTKWQRRGRIALMILVGILFLVQAPLLVTRHDAVVGVALLLAAAHVLSAPLALWHPIPALGLSLLAFTVQALLMMTQGVLGWPWTVAPQVLTQLLVVLVLTLMTDGRFGAMVVLIHLVIGAVLAVMGFAWNGFLSSLSSLAIFAGLALTLVALGVVGSHLRESREALRREQAVSAEEHARRTLVEEKSRIARELHDVIAHNMSLITVQARSAPHRVEGVSKAAEAEFSDIADRAAEALRQMRGVLDVLRTEPGQSGRIPIPGLIDLEDLFAAARATGQEILVDGSLPAPQLVSDDVGAAAYRIVQESLSNARRHASGALVHIELEVNETEWEIHMWNALDDPRGTAVEGHGIVGMRERASAVGGSVTFDSSANEYRLVARLPLLGNAPRTGEDE
ncbi:hypothetical protein D9V41_09985 [Aeromicrobium phragmitis]|uniref:histidine kinase n=1 Tax=Aeromicrobium phragmitis TaxID=2478914 RepID=A0A3L8PK89_9ACTN|nr:histidine kinase [Aeromicrobium phragmitis]RLV55777.1 hypothetical protein D9V41_09985 [Aeromicrobium phragmitis]